MFTTATSIHGAPERRLVPPGGRKTEWRAVRGRQFRLDFLGWTGLGNEAPSAAADTSMVRFPAPDLALVAKPKCPSSFFSFRWPSPAEAPILPEPRFLPVRGPYFALAFSPTLVYAVAVPFPAAQGHPLLPTRDDIMAPEDESPQAPPTDNGEPNLDPDVNKTEATIRLIAEWTKAGKSTRSNVDLVEELNRRYPHAGFTTTNVAQAKQRLKTHEAAARELADVPASPDPAALPSIAPEETDFVRQLRQLVHLLGREAVKRLIDCL